MLFEFQKKFPYYEHVGLH